MVGFGGCGERSGTPSEFARILDWITQGALCLRGTQAKSTLGFASRVLPRCGKCGERPVQGFRVEFARVLPRCGKCGERPVHFFVRSRVTRCDRRGKWDVDPGLALERVMGKM